VAAGEEQYVLLCPTSGGKVSPEAILHCASCGGQQDMEVQSSLEALGVLIFWGKELLEHVFKMVNKDCRAALYNALCIAFCKKLN